jgi:hypothetical protein
MMPRRTFRRVGVPGRRGRSWKRSPEPNSRAVGLRGDRLANDALKGLLKKKQSGQKIEAPREREPSKVVNPMEALRRSVETERGGGERRKPAPRTGDHRAPKKAGRSSARAKKAG